MRHTIKIYLKIAAVFFTLTLILLTGHAYAEPSEDDFTDYVVENGDSLYTIAEKLDVDIESLITDNDITNTRKLLPGQILKVRKNTQDVSEYSKASPEKDESGSVVKENDARKAAADKSSKVSMDMRDADIRDVMSALALYLDSNIIYTEASLNINIRIKDMSPMEALEYVIKANGMEYIKKDNTIVVGKAETLQNNFFDDIVYAKFNFKYLGSKNFEEEIEGMNLPIDFIVLENNPRVIWVQGTPKVLAKVREIVSMLDRDENFSSVRPHFEAIKLVHITAAQMNDILQKLGITTVVDSLDSNPYTLWAYVSEEQLTEIEKIRQRIDIAENYKNGIFQLHLVRLNRITAAEVIPVIGQLGVEVEVIAMGDSVHNLWLKGDYEACSQVESIVKSLDVAYSEQSKQFYMYKLEHVSAEEAVSRLNELGLTNVKAYASFQGTSLAKLAKNILVNCPRDYKPSLDGIIASLDVAGEKIKVPIDSSSSLNGEYKLEARRDLLSELTGIPVSRFEISDDVSRDDTLKYILWVSDTPENVRRIQDMLAKIDNPLN